MPRGKSLLVAAAALLVGSALAVFGGGVALPRIVESGFAPSQLPGLLALAAGVALLVVATVLALRPVPRWWRLLAVPAWLLLIYWLLMPAGTAVFATNAPHADLGSRTPTDVGLEYENVEVPCRDGVRLAGWYVPSRNGAAVVVLHGALSTRTAVLKHAEVLARHGYGVLMIDARGHGESGGRSMDFGWWGELDVDGAVTFLETRPDVENGRVAAFGESMGGEEAITAAAADERIERVIAEGATSRVYDDVAPVLRGHEVFFGVPHYGVLYSVADLLTPAPRPRPLTESMRDIAPRPVLLIATKSEEPYNRRFAEAHGGRVEVWAPASTAHTGGLRENPDEWERRVIAFLEGL